METKKTKSKGFIRFVKGLKLFFFEVLIVVIAVTFSFLLNEWRIERGEKEVEKKILEQVLEDIKTDSAKIKFNTQQIRDLIDGSLRIIELTQDSSFDDYIKRYLSARAVVNYVPFQPSKSGYFELTTQGNAGKIQDKKLLMQIMELYESHYKQLNELNAAHKDFLINNLNQYFVENFPHISHITKTLSQSKQNQLKQALTTDKLKHLLEFDIILKQNILISNSGTLKFQDSLIKRIVPLVD